MAKSEWIVGVVYVAVLAALPFAGHWARRATDQTCAFDGSPIDAAYRVDVVDADGKGRVFCCIGCAQRWLARAQRAPQAIRVTDEISGESLDADAAVFVRSLVVTNRTTENRVHAFRGSDAARVHAAAMGGRVLDQTERPFREHLK